MKLTKIDVKRVHGYSVDQHYDDKVKKMNQIPM